MKGIGRAVFVFLGHILFAFIGFTSTVPGQGLLELANERIENDLLVEILSNSRIIDLEPPKAIQSRLFLRLFAIGELGTCAPDIETEVECSIRYYLAVTSGDLGVPGSVFYLGEVGEISKIEWLESKDPDAVRLRLEVLNYPKGLFEYAPKLKKRRKTVELLVKLVSVTIREAN